jgi:hypothetical protein
MRRPDTQLGARYMGLGETHYHRCATLEMGLHYAQEVGGLICWACLAAGWEEKQRHRATAAIRQMAVVGVRCNACDAKPVDRNIIDAWMRVLKRNQPAVPYHARVDYNTSLRWNM